MRARIVTAAVVAAAAIAAATAAWQWTGRQAAWSEVATSIGATPAGKLRKCRRGAQIDYTNGLCPAGTREEGVGLGTVSMLPAAPPPAASAPKPALRELARSVDPRGMQEQAIDRAIGR